MKRIEIGDTPELLQLVEEVHRLREATMLRHDGENLAMLVPLSRSTRTGRAKRMKAEADYEAFRSAAGGWKDIDTDELIKNIYESRRISTRPQVDL